MESADLQTAEPAAVLEPDWFEPTLGSFVVSFDMNVRRLHAVGGIEEETVRPGAQDGWHGLQIVPDSNRNCVGP